MNNFSKVCPSGNHMVDVYDPEQDEYIDDISDLRDYIRQTLPAFDFGEMRDILREFNARGYIKIR